MSATPHGTAVPKLRIDVERGLVVVRLDFDPELVERVRALPERHYRGDRGEWHIPARRDALNALGQLATDLANRAELTPRAARRLAPHILGWVERRPEGFSLTFPFTPRRLELVRELPDRRYAPEHRAWRLPRSRATALALLELLRTGEFSTSEATRADLERLSRPTCSAGDEPRSDEGERRGRASPIPHWRHVTRGPVFDANRQRHEWVAGVGWCVRVRVDPWRHPGLDTAR